MAVSEVAQALDLSVLRYSKVWEDSRVLSEGLQIDSEDDVFCISSCGDNVLSLLLQEPRSIVAIDMSPAQNSTLELKIAAIKQLELSQFRKLVGVSGASEQERLQLYKAIKADLPEYAQKYWDTHTQTLASGLAFAGRFDLYCQAFADVTTGIVGRVKLDQFFSCSTLDEQKREFESWPLEELKKAFCKHVTPEQQAKKGRSSAQLKHLKLSSSEVIEHVWKKFGRVSTGVPVCDNFYLSWWLRGRRDEGESSFRPDYLREENFMTLKGLVSRVKVVTATIEEFLQSTSMSFSKAALSDMFEYMSEETMVQTLEQLLAKMRRNGRLAYWNALVERSCPPQLLDRIEPLSQLSQALHSRDRVFFYRAFFIDKIL